MKKATVVWLIVAASLVLAGMILFAGVVIAMQGDFADFGTPRYETSEHEITETYQNITVVTDTADVVFLPSENGKTTVIGYEMSRCKSAVEVRDGTLFIERVDTREWYDYITLFNFESSKITVYLPEGTYAALSVKGSTSDVEIPADFSFASIDVALSTGDVTCRASATGAMKLKASTGDILVQNVAAETLALTVTTGSITAADVAVSGDMDVRVSTGDAKLTNVTCADLTSTGNTGDLSLKNVISAGKLDVKRSTGRVTLDACDAQEIAVLTDTGDVTGTLLSDKVFLVQTDTGDVDVPRTTTGGICEITTDTGDIRIRIHG